MIEIEIRSIGLKDLFDEKTRGRKFCKTVPLGILDRYEPNVFCLDVWPMSEYCYLEIGRFPGNDTWKSVDCRIPTVWFLVLIKCKIITYNKFLYKMKKNSFAFKLKQSNVVDAKTCNKLQTNLVLWVLYMHCKWEKNVYPICQFPSTS